MLEKFPANNPNEKTKDVEDGKAVPDYSAVYDEGDFFKLTAEMTNDSSDVSSEESEIESTVEDVDKGPSREEIHEGHLYRIDSSGYYKDGAQITRKEYMNEVGATGLLEDEEDEEGAENANQEDNLGIKNKPVEEIYDEVREELKESLYNVDNKTPEQSSEIDVLKARIDEINTLVRENKMDTEMADMEVALAEEEIRSLEQEDKEKLTKAEVREENKAEEEENDERGSESVEMDEYEKEKAEYLRLKKEFKTSEREYYKAIENDYKSRGVVKKFFGLGRNDMSPDVQIAYDKFILANKNYYEFAQNNGVYQKIVERLYREKKEGEEVEINSAIASRHVLTPAEKRLELQTVKMPEKLVSIKEKILEKVKDYPVAAKTTAVALIGYSLFVNPAAVVSGVSTRYLGNKFYVNALQEEQGEIKTNVESIIDRPDPIDLEEMESEYFEATNKAHNAKNRVKMAAVGAAVGAGSLASMDFANDPSLVGEGNVGHEGTPLSDIGQNVTDSADVSTLKEGVVGTESISPSGTEITPEPAGKAMISKDYENLTHTMKMEDMNALSLGDRIVDKFTREQITELHEILADTLAKGIQEGKIVLPDPLIVDGVDYTHDLVGYVAEKLPDVSRSWEDVLTSDELTKEQWQMIGIRSGDPNNMYLGEKVKIGELLKYIMRDELAASPQNATPISGIVSEAASSEASKSAVPQSSLDNIVHESTQNGHKYGIGEDGTLYKDGQSIKVTGSAEVQDIKPELTEVSQEAAAENIPPEVLEKLRSMVKPTDYMREELPGGGERWINTRNPNDFMEIKGNKSFFSKDFLNNK